MAKVSLKCKQKYKRAKRQADGSYTAIGSIPPSVCLLSQA